MPDKKPTQKRIKSRLPDEIDPAPRILRMVAAALAEIDQHGMFQDVPSTRLHWMARRLEGLPLPDSLTAKPRRWVELVRLETRVPLLKRGKKAHDDLSAVKLRKRRVDTGPRRPASAEEARQIQQLKDAGMWDEDDNANPALDGGAT